MMEKNQMCIFSRDCGKWADEDYDIIVDADRGRIMQVFLTAYRMLFGLPKKVMSILV